MKKFASMLLTGLMLLSVASCNTTEQTTSNNASQNTVDSKETKKETQIPSSTKPAKQSTQKENKSQEESEKLTQSVAVSNAVIIEDNHRDNLVYKHKCDDCGYTEPGTKVTNPGNFTGGFYCSDCKENKVVKIQTTDME